MVEIYEYQAEVIRVVDGDTVWLRVDLGFDVTRSDSFRLLDINAPEMNTAEGKAAKAWLVAQLEGHPTIIVTTRKDQREKYGRYLGVLWVANRNLNEEMVRAGHAVAYFGGAR